jgi:hypothetical protein
MERYPPYDLWANLKAPVLHIPAMQELVVGVSAMPAHQVLPLLVVALFSVSLTLTFRSAYAADPNKVAQLRETNTCVGCDLIGASLAKANLTEADLFSTDLTKTYFLSANLTEASLAGVNLSGVRFEPNVVPSGTSFAYAKGLVTLWWYDSPQGLVLLRNAFKEAGMREQEREVTYAHMKSQREKTEA